MRIEWIECSDGSRVKQYVPQNAADRAEISKMIAADPEAWDFGEQPGEKSAAKKPDPKA